MLALERADDERRLADLLISYRKESAKEENGKKELETNIRRADGAKGTVQHHELFVCVAIAYFKISKDIRLIQSSAWQA